MKTLSLREEILLDKLNADLKIYDVLSKKLREWSGNPTTMIMVEGYYAVIDNIKLQIEILLK